MLSLRNVGQVGHGGGVTCFLGTHWGPPLLGPCQTASKNSNAAVFSLAMKTPGLIVASAAGPRQESSTLWASGSSGQGEQDKGCGFLAADSRTCFLFRGVACVCHEEVARQRPGATSVTEWPLFKQILPTLETAGESSVPLAPSPASRGPYLSELHSLVFSRNSPQAPMRLCP